MQEKQAKKWNHKWNKPDASQEITRKRADQLDRWVQFNLLSKTVASSADRTMLDCGRR